MISAFFSFLHFLAVFGIVATLAVSVCPTARSTRGRAQMARGIGS